MRESRQLKISAEVRDVLARSTVRPSTSMGWVLKLPDGQLDRGLYVEVDKVLKSWHGKWNRSAKAHVFSADPSPLLLAEDGVEDKKWSLQQFFTPPEVAKKVVELAGFARRVLEPSAGTGCLVRAFQKEWWDRDHYHVTLVEKDDALAYKLAEDDHTVFCLDFLLISPHRAFDLVLMNPPYRDGQYAAHVLHALKFLRPGGRLVAVVPANWDDSDPLDLEFTKFGIKEVELDPGAFRASGTNIATSILVFEVPNK